MTRNSGMIKSSIISNKVTMKISEEIFFELMKLKGDFKAKTWDELFKKIIKEHEEKNKQKIR